MLVTDGWGVGSDFAQVRLVLQIVNNKKTGPIEAFCNNFDCETVAFRMYNLNLDVG